MTVTFFIPAEPQPKGSMRAFVPKGWNRPVLTSTNKNLKSYEAVARLVANKAWDRPILPREQAVYVELLFVFSKPKSTPKRVVDKVTKPDIDKLIRGTLDALTGIVWEDDSQVTKVMARKCFGAPGTHVRIEWLG